MEREPQNDAYDYLYATIKMADWISPAYKELAEQYRRNPAIKELYMCICDNVSIDLLELITVDEDTTEVLKKYRKQHLESDFTRKYQEAIDRITVITKTTESELKSLSGTVKQIAENIPVKEEDFYVPSPDDDIGEPPLLSDSAQHEESVPESGTKVENDYKSEDISINPMILHKDMREKSWLEMVKQKCNCIFHLYKQNPKKTVMGMLEQGYKDEQITFILTCMNEGMTEKEIDEISDPALSLQNMELLKRIKLKEREKNGYR